MDYEAKRLAGEKAQPILSLFRMTLVRLRAEGATETDIESMLDALEYENRDLPSDTLEFIMDALRQAASGGANGLCGQGVHSRSADN
jgi:hypothetical protein